MSNQIAQASILFLLEKYFFHIVCYSVSDYSRSETAFAIISLVFAVFAHVFAIYAIREPRYMFKWLAGMLYLIAGRYIYCLVTHQYGQRPKQNRLLQF
jgi:glucan phosphoethanolaminetransferase (alkaline phosphatase superfamily)